MNKTGKIIIGIFLFFLAGFLFIIYDEMRYNKEISEIYDHDVSKFDFGKPRAYLDSSQLDSMKNLKVNKPKIEVIGSGHNSYDFYMWYKAEEIGNIYIKGYELTNNNQISKNSLSERTNNKIDTISGTYIIYKGRTVIAEGTFEKFYPVRFELWFNPINGKEIKLTQKKYLIDGWDR